MKQNIVAEMMASSALVPSDFNWRREERFAVIGILAFGLAELFFIRFTGSVSFGFALSLARTFRRRYPRKRGEAPRKLQNPRKSQPRNQSKFSSVNNTVESLEC